MLGLPIIRVLEGGREEAWAAGFNAQHNAFRIRIWRDIDHFAAVLAQERYELALRWRWLFVALFRKREVELRGHAVEVVVACEWYGAQEKTKLDEEARALRDGYDGLFDGWTKGRIIAALKERLPLADAWTAKHERQIDADYRLGGGNDG